MNGRVLTIGLLILATASPVFAQKHRPAKKKAPAKEAPAEKPAIVGKQITVVTTAGEKITGAVEEFSDKGVKLGVNGQDKLISFETVATISFVDPPAADAPEKPTTHPHPRFSRDAETVLSGFQAMEAEVRSAPDYTDYSRQLTELKRTSDKFVAAYSMSDDPTELRITALLSGAVNDYTWARTIWTLRLGRPANAAVSTSDSPVVSDALQLYPDLSPAAGTGASAEKLIAGLAAHAAGKVALARKLLNPEGK